MRVAAVLGTDPSLLEKYQPGPVALLIVAILGVVLALLLRSLNVQLKRIRFDESATDDAGRMRGNREPDGGEDRP